MSYQDPLKTVVGREQRARGGGVIERLECGHGVPWDGSRSVRRRCPRCGSAARLAQPALPE